MKIIQHIWCDIYQGRGYLQGLGLDIKVKRLDFFINKQGWPKFSIITDIKVDVESNWLNKLKEKL
jgi:hypothetical protein